MKKKVRKKSGKAGKFKKTVEPPERVEFSYKASEFISPESFKLQQAIEAIVTDCRTKAIDGDKDALALLNSIGIMASGALMQVLAQRPGMVKEYAQEQLGWSIFLTANPHLNKMFIDSVKDLNLASKAGISYDPAKVLKQFIPVKQIAYGLQMIIDHLRKLGRDRASRDQLTKLPVAERTESVRLQMAVLQHDETSKNVIRKVLQAMRDDFGAKGSFDEENEKAFVIESLHLPPLTKDSLKKWFSLARKIFIYLTDGHPESNKKLKNIGNYRGQLSKNSNDSLIRDGIITAIRQAFKLQAKMQPE